jgi:8-amino-7-oxononanoate synthase
VDALRAAGRALAEAVGLAPTPGAVLQLVLGDPHRAVAAQQACREQGVRVGCFRPPSVPLEQSCLRLTARADLIASDIQRAADAVLAAVAG